MLTFPRQILYNKMPKRAKVSGEVVIDLNEAYIAENKFTTDLSTEDLTDGYCEDISSNPKEEVVEKKMKPKKLKKNEESAKGGENSDNKKDDAQTGSEQFDESKKKKRPWRQAVRHRAKRARLENKTSEPIENAESNSKEPDEDASPANLSKRQKYKLRKKMKKMFASKSETQNSFEQSAKKELEHEENGNQQIDPQTRLEASYFRFINEKLYTTHSTDAVQLFEEDPKAFEAYHKGYSQQAKKWPMQPIDTIIMDLSTLPEGSKIADIGCGEAKLAQKLGQKYSISSFDLVALNDNVTVADMADLPVEGDSMDACVFCLSLMGTNLHQFIREAHRILKKGGKMKIAEVSSRFSNVNQFISAVEKMGFSFTRKKELAEKYFVILTFQKTGKIENKHPLGLKLNPCLYKKR